MDKPFSPYINYPKLVDDAMRDIAIKLIKSLEFAPLRGEHHFLISFITKFPGVILSDRLLQKYPEEMTIVLQHQFADLKTSEKEVSVKLSFGGIQENIVLPFAALTAFVDPSSKFSLQFNPNFAEITPQIDNNSLSKKPQKTTKAPKEKILVLDHFRKNN